MKAVNDKGIRFIRKNGRIIPIRVKPQGQKPSSSGEGFIQKHRTKIIAGISAAVGLAAYMGLRKFRRSGIETLGALQDAVERAGGYTLYTGKKASPMSTRFQALVYGNKVHPAGKPISGDVLFNHVPSAIDGATHTINPLALAEVFGSKKQFGKLFGGRFAPKTMPFDEVMMKAGGDPKKIAKVFGTKDFIVKPDFTARNKLSDFLNQSSIGKKSAKASHARLNPSDYVIQETLKLKNEYRAHYLNGQVYGISHRNVPNDKLRSMWDRVSKDFGGAGGAFVPVVGKKREEIKSFVETAMRASGGTMLGKNGFSLHTAFDIGDTGRGLQLIEGQPMMGTFDNPWINRQFNRHVSGRWGRDVAGTAGLAAASTAGFASSSAITDRRQAAKALSSRRKKGSK